MAYSLLSDVEITIIYCSQLTTSKRTITREVTVECEWTDSVEKYNRNRLGDSQIDAMAVLVWIEAEDTTDPYYISTVKPNRDMVKRDTQYYEISKVEPGENPVMDPTMVLYLKESKRKPT